MCCKQGREYSRSRESSESESAPRRHSAQRRKPQADVGHSAIPRSRSAGRSGERPQNSSPRPYAESDLDTMNRCTVFPDASRDGASIDVLLRDTNDLRWPAGPAPALPSTGATAIATTATVDVSRAKVPMRTREDAELRKAKVCRRSIRVARAVRAAGAVFNPPRIACRVPSGDDNVNGFSRTGYWRATTARS